MRNRLTLRGLSLKTKLIASYLVILASGGLATSVLGSWIVSNTIMQQAQRSVQHNIVTARALFDQELATLGQTVELAAASMPLPREADANAVQRAYLARVRIDAGFDFLTVTDAAGVVLRRWPDSSRRGDSVSSIEVVRAALSGQAAAAPEILTAARLQNEHPSLRNRARIPSVDTPAGRVAGTSLGMVLMGAAPLLDPSGHVTGALYGGKLLNHHLATVDRLWSILYAGEEHGGQAVGAVSIFLGDLRIATTVPTAAGTRALGTVVSDEVRAAVLERGDTWNRRAFEVRDWYISAYQPIRNHAGLTIGMLHVGVLEKRYTSLRNRVIGSFFAIASVGFAAIIGITYLIVQNITRPVAEMVSATQDIAAGRFDHHLRVTSQDEIGSLAQSFNTMLASLRTLKHDLEEWGRTLETKVRERTDELTAMQARVSQTERLASLGLLSAGVAHEINNPLGGILALTALSLEDMEDGDPRQGNLREVVRQAQRCKEIVRGLLDFSRQSEISVHAVKLDSVIASTLALVENQALFFNISVIKKLNAAGAVVLGDSSQLQQVFLNIVMNAVQAMDERGTLVIETTQTEDDWVEARVTDSGRGIPADQIDRVFDPFFTTKLSGTGTGLGLSIAYGIIAKHQGTISVASEVGRGSTFTVRLPCAPAYAEAEMP